VGAFFQFGKGGCRGLLTCPLSAIHFLYTNTMPSLSIVKVLPSMVPVVIPAPCYCMVSLEPSLV
jgi:hypothetical protein